MTALLLASLFLQDAKARFAEAKDRLNRHVWEARLDLGDWCREKGLAGAAVRHYEFVRERVPAGHPYAGRAIRKLNGSWKSKPDTADEAIRAEHRRRCEAYAREAAERAFACFRIAKEGGLKDLATRALEQTVEFDVDHAGARGERDEVRVDGFGWVPRAEEKEWREVERSEHFLLYTDRKDARATLDRLERVYKAFYELMGDRFTRPQDRMGVCWLENAEAFERIRARVPGAPAAGSMAFYSTVTHVAYCVADPTSLAHEVTHGLADRGAGAFTSSLLCAGLRGDARRDYWVVEGLACALAEARIEGGRAIFSAGALPAGFDSAPFMRMGVTEFLRDAPRHYSIAQALVVGLILGPCREKFLDFVRDFYDGRGDFSKTVGRVALEADSRIAQIVDAFEFPSAEDIAAWTAKGPEYKRLLDVMLGRAAWITAVKRIEERMGPFDEDWRVTIRLGEWEGTTVGSGERAGDRGAIAFNMTRLGEYERMLEEQRRHAQEMRKKSMRVTYKVPPIRYEGIVTHELTHVAQGECRAPFWFLEGQATWVAGDEGYILSFAHKDLAVQSIETPLADWEQTYPRGMLFFMWLEGRRGREAIRGVFESVAAGGDWKQEFEGTLELSWEKIVEAEQAWSADTVRRKKPR